MKLDLKKNNILRSIFSKSKKDGFDSYFNPARHWMFGLIVAVALLCTGIFFVVFDFYTQFGTSGDVSLQDDQVVIYNEKEVKITAGHLIEDKKIFDALRSDTPYIPSTPVPLEEVATSTEVQISPGETPLADVPLEQ